MNKLMIASLTLLLGGAIALPADAQDNRRRGGNDVAADSDRSRGDRGERNEQRAERRQRPADQRNNGPRNIGDRSAPPAVAQGRRFQPGNPPAAARGRGPAPTYQAAVRAPQPPATARWNGDRGGNRGDRRDGRRDDRWDRRDDRRDTRYDRRDDRRDDRYDRRNDRRDFRYARGNDRRWHGNRWHPQYRYRAPVRYVYPRGYRAYQWQVGHRLPANYYHRNYYVDYRSYRLPPPPYGYHWVRVDRDVVLVAIASGLIRDILYGLYY